MTLNDLNTSARKNRNVLTRGLAVLLPVALLGFAIAATATPRATPPLAKMASTEGESIYIKHCAGCHDGGFKGWMTGAPTMGDYSDWKPYFSKGIEKMVHNVVTGEKKHEKNGGCKKCVPAGIRNAVEHIVAQTPEK